MASMVSVFTILKGSWEICLFEKSMIIALKEYSLCINQSHCSTQWYIPASMWASSAYSRDAAQAVFHFQRFA